jgi:hypothetical protein
VRRAIAVVVLLLLTACSSGDGDDDALPPFCQAYGELLVGPLADDTTDTDDPEILEAAVTSTLGVLARLVDAAPDGMGDDATALAASYDEAFATLARYGYDLDRVEAEATDEENALLNGFGSSDPAPFQAIQQWVADHCAGEVTLPSDLTVTTATTSP